MNFFVCENDDNHNEHQKNEQEDVKEDIKIIKCGEREYKNVVFYFKECVWAYDYQSRASQYSCGLTHLTARVTTNLNHVTGSQKVKEKKKA